MIIIVEKTKKKRREEQQNEKPPVDVYIFKEPKCTYFLVTVVVVPKRCPRAQPIPDTLQTRVKKKEKQNGRYSE